ncbi:CvpA family protein [Adhaeribacter soli]|uniref:CvpA family protein n=1 Tax=Adhaeribacter soli TaxID=2607655 RepID=A0A5N1ILF5_9BACT|nr:CvpA family protein [Adhaeribacter soli]KAA9325464.1 CvpA family protein [Adhaeribacter soli]
MTTFDWFLAIPLAYGAFMGFRKGLLLEIVSLLALIIGVLGGLKLLNAAIPVMKSFIGDVFGLLPLLTFLVVFALIILGVRMVGIALKKVIGLTPLGLFDNVLGAGIGALKWCMAIGLLLHVSQMAGVSIAENASQTSVIYPYVVKATPLALDLIGLALPFAKTLLSVLKGLF